MLTIRSATAQDHAAIEALWEEAQLPTVSREEWDILLSGPTVVLLAEDESGLAGAAVASFDGWRAYIYHVAVDPTSRHQGVATAIIREAEARLAQLGARTVYVMVHESNSGGLALTVREGFAPAPGELVLKKEIGAAARDAARRVRRRSGIRLHR